MSDADRDALARVLYGQGVDLPLYDPIDIDFTDVADAILANRDAVLRALAYDMGEWMSHVQRTERAERERDEHKARAEAAERKVARAREALSTLRDLYPDSIATDELTAALADEEADDD